MVCIESGYLELELKKNKCLDWVLSRKQVSAENRNGHKWFIHALYHA
jgi:hypothetical protein